MYFKDRRDAGEKLVPLVRKFQDFDGWTIIGIARGGVIVAKPIAETLSLPLRSIVVEETKVKDGSFYTTSLGSGTLWPDRKTKPGRFAPAAQMIYEGTPISCDSARERNTRYNGSSEFPCPERGLLCDDGLFTGQTFFAALASLKYLGVKEIIAAIPVVPPNFKRFTVPFITWRVSKERQFPTGTYYFTFEDVSDEEVVEAVQDCRDLTHA